jgi:hypothetical protein
MFQSQPIDVPFVTFDREVLQSGAGFACDDLPRNQIGMMLHLGDQNRIAGPEMRATPGARYEIDPFGRSASKNDRIRRSGSQVCGNRGPRFFVEFRGSSAQLVNSAVNIGMVLPIVPANFIDHAIRVLSRRGVVQIDQTMAVYLLIQNRKVGSVPARRKIDYHNGLSTHRLNGATKVPTPRHMPNLRSATGHFLQLFWVPSL